MRICSKCKVTKEDGDFHKDRPDGKIYHHCKECQREYGRQHYQRNRPIYLERAAKAKIVYQKQMRQHFLEYLRTHPCVDCGEKNIVVLQFDHVRGKKIGHVTKMVDRYVRFDSVMKEIEKCDVRCANCHIKRTSKSRNFWKESAVPV